MRKVLFLADSLALPRLVPEFVGDADVWCYRVSFDLRAKYRFFFYTVAGLDTSSIVKALRIQLGGYQPDVVVLQVGIVDAAPKALRRSEYQIVIRLPEILRQPIHRLIRRHYRRIVTWRDITYVSLVDFESNLTALRKTFAAASFVVVPIGQPNAAYIRKNPLIARNVLLYNEVLRRVFGAANVLDEIFSGDVEDLFASDHHHLSARGHALVGACVTRRLDQLLIAL